MKCPSCQHESPAGTKICGKCGARLPAICTSCGASNPATNKFCGECGASLTMAGAAPKFASPESYTPRHLAEKILSSKSALEGERKQVTVLFADLKGSMELLLDRDPEEARRLLDPVLERMMEAVHRYEGTVNQVMGDGIMALFGAPVAHEDHAIRACYAALDMQAGIRRHAEEVQRSQGVRVAIRVGLNSGEVVVRAIGSDLHMDYTAVGQTTHLAARMEQLAHPGTTLLTPNTLRLAEGYLEVQALGPVPVKGLEAPVEVYELLGAAPSRSRLHPAVARGLTRFVGRDAELEELRQALGRAAGGSGQVVAVVGEPGVGKSRLVWEVTHSHLTHGWLVVGASAVSYGKSTPYLPVIDLLKSYFKIQDRDGHREIGEKLTGKLLTLDRTLEPLLPAFLSLLDVPIEDPQWDALDPPERRQRTLDALKRLLLHESQIQPLLIVFEDLHWIDSETQAVLDILVENLSTVRLLLLVNYRPEYEHRWGDKAYYTQLRLDPLGGESADELLRALLGHDASLLPLKRVLIERTEGNPFFLEESVRTLSETDVLVGERGEYRLARPLPTVHVPASVQAVLAARIDRLPPADKRLLQTASVIGKNVPVALLETITDLPDVDLRRGLDSLERAHFLYEDVRVPDPEYVFTHALTHEVAYGSLVHQRRRSLHARIGDVLEQRGDSAETRPELLAHHYTEAGLVEQGIAYWIRAGQRAVERSAHIEAIAHLTKGLTMLQILPDAVERARTELTCRLALGSPFVATQGYAATAVEETYLRARELCHQLADTVHLGPVLWGLYAVYLVRGELAKAQQFGEQLFALAEDLASPDLSLEARRALGTTFLYRGEFTASLAHLDQGIALYDPARHRSHALRYAADPGVACRAFAAQALWMLGYPDRALARIHDLLALARELGHTYSSAFALAFSALVYQCRREVQHVRIQADAAVSLSSEQGFPHWLAMGTILNGWARASEGHRAEGLALMQRGLRAWEMTGAGFLRPYYLTLLAGQFGETGQVDEGLRLVSEALALIEANGERAYEAELHRLKGELLLKSTRPHEDNAERCFREALAIARRQQARSWELRAAGSLGRLCVVNGRQGEARQILADASRGCSEGFETPDLREVRALLEALR